MSLAIGIVGLPNVGKSTLFNALTRAGAAVASYPFTTIEPNVGVVPIEDSRLEEIAALIKPDEVIPTTIRFVDIAGLVKGAHRGEGLGNQFLGHIRDVDAIAMVVRCFEAGDVPHTTETLDPVDDISAIDTELILADLATVERRLERVQTASKGRTREFAAEVKWLEDLLGSLDSAVPAPTCDPAHTGPECEWLRGLNLLSAKPRLFVANVTESGLPDGGALARQVLQRAQTEDAAGVVVCAQLEADLAGWQAEEATEYRAELGLSEPGLQRLVRAGYELLGLITFFTTTGGKIVQAWTVPQGRAAPQAAGQIHTDMEHGFIRAEVVNHSDLVAAGGMHQAREQGLVRLEGKDYRIMDGDVVHFRFAV
jgi:GTP-binding protein YchF